MLRARGSSIEYRGAASHHMVLYISGAWINPFDEVRSLSRQAKSRIWPLLEAYGEEVGLAINPLDRDLIFLAVFLSRSTDFHRNTVRWSRLIISRTPSLRRLSPEDAWTAGSSYHLKQLPRALREYYERIEPAERVGASVEEVKARLLGIRFVGVKTALAYLLFTNPTARHLAPYDTHFAALSRILGLLSPGCIPPRKSLCIAHTCSTCPIRGRCAVATASRLYRGLAGWLQTVCYLHSKLYCRRRMCDNCSLRSLCSRDLSGRA